MQRKFPSPVRALQLALTASLALACFEGDEEDDGSTDMDAADSGAACSQQALAEFGSGKLDLLFVIDNSGSMAQEQAKLSAQIPALLTSLSNGQAADGTTFTPMRDLHVGVITTDMGLSGSLITLPPSCGGFGDDGMLVRTQEGCETHAPAGYLTYRPDINGTLDQTLTDLSCLASVGINGCGFEQQLEAMYKALAPSSVKFAGDTPGHADEVNRGFLRPDAALAVVILSDEEDCSVSEEGFAMFDDNTNHPAVKLPGSESRIGLNLRCFFGDPSARENQAEAAGLVLPVERYVDEFKRNVKPGGEESVLFIAIVGIPDGMEGKPASEILAHPRMGFAVDPATGGGDPTNRNTAALDVCRQCAATTSGDCMAEPLNISDGNGFFGPNPNIITGAKPGVRFVKVAQGFGDNGLVQSICAESYAPALNNLVQKIARLPAPATTKTSTDCTP